MQPMFFKMVPILLQFVDYLRKHKATARSKDPEWKKHEINLLISKNHKYEILVVSPVLLHSLSHSPQCII